MSTLGISSNNPINSNVGTEYQKGGSTSEAQTKSEKLVSRGIQADVTSLPDEEFQKLVENTIFADLAPEAAGIPKKLIEAYNRFTKALEVLGNKLDESEAAEETKSQDAADGDVLTTGGEFSNVSSGSETEPQVFSGSTSFLRDIGRTLGRLMVELAGLQRQEALDSRLAAREQAKAELRSQADKLTDSAHDNKTAAMKQVAMTLICSAVSIGLSAAGAAGSLKSGTQRLSLNKQAQTLNKQKVEIKNEQIGLSRSKAEAADFRAEAQTSPKPMTNRAIDTHLRNQRMDANSLNQKELELDARSLKLEGKQLSLEADGIDVSRIEVRSQQQAALGMTVGQLAPSMGTLASMNDTEKAKLAEADASRFGAEAEETRGEGDVSKEVQQSLNEMVTAMINFLKELRSAEVEQMAAITRG